MSENCVCGGSTANPNMDCERCQLKAKLAAETKRADEATEALAALDSLPAEEADGRWETLRKWLPVVADDWDRAGMPQKKFAVAYIIDKMDQIDAVISAPSPPAAESRYRWHEVSSAIYDEVNELRRQYEQCGRKEEAAMLWEALRVISVVEPRRMWPWTLLQNNDISNSGPAAQQTGEG